MYPSLPGNISELIKEDVPFKTFRKKYLGQEEKRKPLFRAFNSRFVRDLHQLTPRTRATNFSVRVMEH